MTKKNKSMQELNKASKKTVNLNQSLPKVLVDIFRKGDIYTKLSFLIMGFSNLVRGQIIKGCVFLATQIAFIYFMLIDKGGLFMLKGLTTLGEKDTIPGKGFQAAIPGDDSRKFLLFGVVSVVLCVLYLILWAESIRAGYIAQVATDARKKPNSFYKDIKDYFDSKIHRTLLFIPIMGILVMTIIPIIFMISMAFTNFDSKHNGEMVRFTWTGFDAFNKVLNMGAGGKFSYTFWRVLVWTIIWAVLTTITCYVGGIIIAMLINSKQVKFKAFWRTMFIMTAATPQFVTLLLMKQYLEDNGLLNAILKNLGIISENIDWLSNTDMARVVVIIVNFWIGVPFTILITRIKRSIAKIKSREMAEFNLKGQHVSCLYYLHKFAPITFKELCDVCMEDKAALSRSIEHLEKNGYLARSEALGKTYKVRLVLTEKGIEASRRISSKIDYIISLSSKDISSENLEIFYDCLTQINNNLEKIANTRKPKSNT